MTNIEASPNELAFRATNHCLTGCGIGEVLGLVLATWWGWSDVPSIALAVVRDGIKRRSEEGVKAGRDVLYAWAGGKSHKVKVVSPVFVDPEGARQNV